MLTLFIGGPVDGRLQDTPDGHREVVFPVRGEEPVFWDTKRDTPSMEVTRVVYRRVGPIVVREPDGEESMRFDFFVPQNMSAKEAMLQLVGVYAGAVIAGRIIKNESH